MQLNKKKALAAKVLGVGKNRVMFVEGNLNEIKEAITRQDIADLYRSGAIKIKEITGRRKIKKRKHRRRVGKIKQRPQKRKQEYVILTRKLRKVAKHLLITGKVDKDKYRKIRKGISDKKFKSKNNLLDNLGEM